MSKIDWNIHVFVLDPDIEELKGKENSRITIGEFIVLGKEYSLEEFEDILNKSIISKYNPSVHLIKFA